MKTIEEILADYGEYELDDFLGDQRFSKRFLAFLTDDQIEENIRKLGYKYNEGTVRTVLPWTEENILQQLHEDVNFGWEKACDEKGISSELMAYVVIGWNRVLENGLGDLEYSNYGKNIFKATAEKYGWTLEEDENDEPD